MHDPLYKLIFSEPRMVEDLLRAFVPGTWTDTLDFSTLDKQPAEYVGENLRRRLGDCCGGSASALRRPTAAPVSCW